MVIIDVPGSTRRLKQATASDILTLKERDTVHISETEDRIPTPHRVYLIGGIPYVICNRRLINIWKFKIAQVYILGG